MKITYISDAVYPYNKGGKEKRLYDISTRLAARGHDVHIYCMKWWDSPELMRVEEGVHLHAISPFYSLYDGERRSIRQGVLFGLHCLKLIREQWDVIDVDHMPFFPIFFAKIVCVLKGKRMYATWHEVWGRAYWVKYMGWKGNIAYIIERIATLLPDHIISVSELTTKLLGATLHRQKNITTIYSGLDTNTIAQVKPHHITSDIIYTGRLLKHKNIHLMIEAVALLQDDGVPIRAIIVGEGPEKVYLVERARALGVADQITFYDFFPSHRDVIALMKSSKLFIFPSEREGFGLVALEANACGIPFVTLDAPGNAATYLISGTNGYRFVANAKSLAGMIQKGLQNKPDKNAYQEIVQKYSWDNSVRDLLHVYTV